ncbi:MAG: discoidin domain-containing protein [Myxococcaceae bacterium]|nr:discoidin domain-containing protein [Myxococcaceae bacterium]
MNEGTREALWAALVELAPAGTTRTWQALARVAPPEAAPSPQLVERLSVSPPEAVEVSESQVREAATRAREAATRATQARRHAAIRSQAGIIGGVSVGLWLTAAVVLGATRATEPTDLAKGKPWRASSQWAGVTCDPVHGLCGPLHSRIFFHTNDDDSPWVEIDLGKPTTFSKLTIVNRKDENLQARAVPLVIEVSDDQSTWRQIARRDETFDDWKVELAAPATARFVRARIDRKSWLHLEAVKVHP